MNVLIPLLLACVGGIGLGFFYFGGLWLTVRRIPDARRPVLLSFSSFFARLAITLFGFYLVMAGHWERLLVCLLGFLCVRAVLVRVWGPDRNASDLLLGEVNRRAYKS